ncbi:MAG: hypothetical protein E7018_01630 [Alphaproteobacteria bacterium]|nr:hypothetical protein [Alphaproteobacteria bacterium]
MSRLKLINLMLLASFLCACSQFRPFVDRRREAGAKTQASLYVGKSTPQNPAICYNALYTPYKDVKKLADEVCVKEKTGTHAVPVKQTIFTCRILVPNHLYFKCEK